MFRLFRLLKHFFRSRRQRDHGTGTPADGVQLDLSDAHRNSTASSETSVTAHTEETNLLSLSYFDSAQKLRRTLPQTCAWLKPEDLLFTGEPPVGGRYADVWKGRLDGRDVYIKAYRCYVRFDPDSVRMRFYKEVHAYSLLSHRNIAPFVGVHSTPQHPFSLVFDSPVEHLNLSEYSRTKPRASNAQLVTGIARGLDHMHAMGVVHGNIESTNVLIGSDGVPRIAGLGSAFIPSFPIGWLEESFEFTRYSAPELVNPGLSGLLKAQTSKESDVYAFAVLAYEVFAGSRVFPHLFDNAATYHMSSGARPPRPHDPQLSDQVWEMITKCWANIPSQRITIAEAVSFLETELRQTCGTFPFLVTAGILKR